MPSLKQDVKGSSAQALPISRSATASESVKRIIAAVKESISGIDGRKAAINTEAELQER